MATTQEQRGIPEEVRKKIRRIEITTGKLVDEVFAGKYESLFKGRGIEFAEFREYMPGDDVRNIDWNVTARFGRPFVKRNEEERELSMVLMVDASGSQAFGSGSMSKRELAGEIGAILAFSALRNNDKVGLLQYTDRVERYIPPRKGRRHALRLIRDILEPPSDHRATDTGLALDYLNRVHKRRALVFLLSDFLGQSYEKALRLTARRHDLSAFRLFDPREEELPDVGRIRLQDLESGRLLLLDTSNRSFREQYRAKAVERRRQLKRAFDVARVDYAEFSTERSPAEALVRFFAYKKARHRLRRSS
ncbi:MAG: DUF58 domain-containing protein [Armatimonadetes bacterium]|nr:DUF58 domain-containing protein [Armatimonadota bacterium]